MSYKYRPLNEQRRDVTLYYTRESVACSRLSISGSERKQRRAKNQAIQGERAGAKGRPPSPDSPHFFLARPPLVVRTH